MPPRLPPKIYSIWVKTHKTAVLITASPITKIDAFKSQTLEALQALPDADAPSDYPSITSADDFELCKASRDRSTGTTKYEPAPVSSTIRDVVANSWETLYMQFKDSEGNLMPVEVTLPSLLDEEDEEPRKAPEADASSSSKGKRKAPPE